MMNSLFSLIMAEFSPLILLFLLTISPILSFIDKRKAVFFLFSIIFIAIIGGVLSLENDFSYVFGNWTSDMGISWRNNSYVTYFTLFTWATSAYIIYSYKNLILMHKNSSKLVAIISLLIVGAIGLVYIDDFFNIYVFIEIISLTSYILISTHNNARASISAFKYLIVGSIAGSLYLIAVALIYMKTGQLNIQMASNILDISPDDLTSQLAFTLILISFFIKMSIFPFNSWTISVYAHSSPIYLLMSSSILNKVYILVLANMLNEIDSFAYFINKYNDMLSCFLIISSIYSAIALIYSKKIMHLLMWSSASNLCYILLILFSKNADIYGAMSIIIAAILGESIAKLGLTNFVIELNEKSIINVKDFHKVDFYRFGNRYKTASWIFLFAGLPPSALFFIKYNALVTCVGYGVFIYILTIISIALGLVGALKFLENIMSTAHILDKDKISLSHIQSPLLWIIASCIFSLFMTY